MATVTEELVESGIPEKDIAFIYLDSRKYRSVATPLQLESAIDVLVDDGSEKYLFIDEVQSEKGFEEVVNTHRNDGCFFDLPHGVELVPFVR